MQRPRYQLMCADTFTSVQKVKPRGKPFSNYCILRGSCRCGVNCWINSIIFSVMNSACSLVPPWLFCMALLHTGRVSDHLLQLCRIRTRGMKYFEMHGQHRPGTHDPSSWDHHLGTPPRPACSAQSLPSDQQHKFCPTDSNHTKQPSDKCRKQSSSTSWPALADHTAVSRWTSVEKHYVWPKAQHSLQVGQDCSGYAQLGREDCSCDWRYRWPRTCHRKVGHERTSRPDSVPAAL